MAEAKPNITLYTAQTPNGIKISITLEELGLPYTVRQLDMGKNEQKEPWFLAINPNGRIPAITDTFVDGESIRVFESGSVMQYLVDRYDTEHKISFPKGSREAVEVNNWLFFLNAGVGPMQGQANHFGRYAPEDIPYAKTRYTNETRRLYGVLDAHLADGNKQFLVGDRCTIADIAHWGWVAAAGWAGVNIEEFPHLKAWEERMGEREAFKKGRDVPTKWTIKELVANSQLAKEQAEKAKAWIQAGMKEDAKN